MAYMNQERKKLIDAELKKVVPAGWKYSLAVRNNSTICFTLREAPVDILGDIRTRRTDGSTPQTDTTNDLDKGYCELNVYYVPQAFSSPQLVDVFCKIRDALNTGNWDKSDPMTDYFNVGWYVDMSIGRWDTPFIDVLPTTAKTSPAYSAKNLKKPGKWDVDTLISNLALPADFLSLSPGKKAAATKQAMKNFPSLFNY